MYGGQTICCVVLPCDVVALTSYDNVHPPDEATANDATATAGGCKYLPVCSPAGSLQSLVFVFY